MDTSLKCTECQGNLFLALRTVERLLRQRTFPVVKVGRRVLVPEHSEEC